MVVSEEPVAENPRIEELRKRLEKEPGSRLFAQLAEELRKAGELEEAIRVSRAGLQKHPAYPSARMTLGRALMDTGDVGGARSEFEAVLKGAPDNILASRFLGECLETLGDLKQALARYKATLVLAAGDKQVQARIDALEARMHAPGLGAAAAPGGGPASRLAEGTGGGESVEPPPIPVSAADEVFEIERPYEAGRTVVGGVAEGRLAPPEDVEPEPLVEPEPPVEHPEPAPIPVVAADEGFELERPYELPAPAVGPSAAAAVRPALAPEEALGEPDEPPAPTLPFQPAPVLEIPAGPPASVRHAEPAAEESPEILSSTLAELYFNQGFTDRALDVYRQLLDREPRNERALARLREIESLERHLRAEEKPPAVSGAPAVPLDSRSARREAIERTIVRLEGLLAALKRG